MTTASSPTMATSFFKVILSSTLHNGKLKIPNKFVKDHGEELGEWVSLSVQSGGSWIVRIQRERDTSIWFHDGLLKFMEDNSVGIEFFVTFDYRGGSKFNVLIFDTTATEIQYNCINASATWDVSQIPNADIREDSAHDSIDCLGSSAGHLFSPVSAEPSKSTLSHKRSQHVSCETSNITRCYLTRGKKQMLDRERMVEGVNVCSTPPIFAEPSKPVLKLKQENNINRSYLTRRKLQMLDIDRSVEGVNVCSTPPTFAEPSKPASKFKEENNIKRCYLTRSKRQMLDGGITVEGLNVSSALQRIDMGRQPFERLSENHESIEDNRKTNDCSGGKNSPKYKVKKDSDDGSSTKECADESIIPAENMTFPTSFKVTLKSYNIQNLVLAVPSEFARRNMPHSTKLIKIFDSDDNEWVVRFICSNNGQYSLGKGWGQFLRVKKLMTGDICTFERVWGDEVKLKATISRPVK